MLKNDNYLSFLTNKKYRVKNLTINKLVKNYIVKIDENFKI